jgi:hypothetical protein
MLLLLLLSAGYRTYRVPQVSGITGLAGTVSVQDFGDETWVLITIRMNNSSS